MRRAADAGWHCLYVPGARVVHVEGAATGVDQKSDRPPRRPAYRYRSWARYHRRAGGRGGALLAAAARLAGSGGNRILGLLPGRRTAVAARFFPDFARHALWPLLRGDPDVTADGGAGPDAGSDAGQGGRP